MNRIFNKKSATGLKIKHAFLILLACFIIGLISTILTGKILEDTDFRTLINYMLSLGIPVFVAIKIYEKYADKYSLNISTKYLKLIPILMPLPILLQFGLTSHLVHLIPMPEYIKQMFYEMGNGYSWENFLLPLILAPVLEEILCRGIILKGLLNNCNPRKAIFVSSIIFGLLHFNPWQFIGAFGIGLINGWIFWKTKNILLAIAMHFANNFFFMLFGIYFGTAYLVDKPMRAVFGSPLNQTLAIVVSLLLLLAILFYLKQRFETSKTKHSFGNRDAKSIQK
ncbi:lysostaphin resistance A-like protein [Salinimicrobium sp. GXAS 041]|uniref:CPBP family intramembrane glutamic endopeptidase n=1 Tax=Salinimicrobium sp. GXAS 041 TaxID=3400806 RepID=UPI003C72A5DB